MRGFAYDLRNVRVHLSEALCTKQMQVRESRCEIVVPVMMMMIAFITFKSSLVPLFEGL